MGKFDGMLILSDIDGTLTYSTEISDKNAKAIRYFQENGGYFTVATGRQPPHIKLFEPAVKVNAPVVALNGTVIYDFDKDKVLRKAPLVQKFSHITEYVFNNHPDISDIHFNRFFDSIQWNRGMGIAPDVDNSDNDILKVVFMSQSSDAITTLKEDLSERFPEFTFFKSWDKGMELIEKNCGKGESIPFLKSIFPVHTVIGIGDYENDITLINKADIGIAAANSSPLLLKNAKNIGCDCKDNLIAYVIERIEGQEFVRN